MVASAAAMTLPSPPGEALRNIVEALDDHALAIPASPACTFLDTNGQEIETLTFSEMRSRALRIAHALRCVGAAGKRAILLYPPGTEYLTALFGCFYSGCVGVPIPYPRLLGKRAVFDRLHSIAADSRPAVVLTRQSFARYRDATVSSIPELRGVPWIETCALDEAPADFLPVVPQPGALAFLQYTSGSISRPKGVMVSFDNLAYNHRMLNRAANTRPGLAFVSWLPLFHDMGLIASALMSINEGMHFVLLSPASFLQRPYAWLSAVSKYRAHASGSPNFGYDLCASKITAEQAATLDLSSWKVAFNGSEPIRSATLERFFQAFSSCGFKWTSFFPSYGLAEASVFVSSPDEGTGATRLTLNKKALETGAVEVSTDPADAITLVGCGHTWLDQQIRIVDSQTGNPCEPGRVGEVWVSGANVSQGYWNHPEETNETFGASIAAAPGNRFLRTGDLGFMHDGELFVTGRLKDLIIVDGRNHYPQDVELTVEASHPAICPGRCAAFVLEGTDRERLVVVAEVDRSYNPNRCIEPRHRSQTTSPISGCPAATQEGQLHQAKLSDIIRAGRAAVSAQHDLQTYKIVLLRPATIPKTSSGKLQRKACRAAWIAGTLQVWAEG